MSTRRPTGSVVVLAALLVAAGALILVGVSGDGGPPTRAQQAHDIAASVRCPVCKDLSAADSPAPLARQMRTEIRSRLADGATPAEIRQGFVEAYGPSVLMSPPDRGWGRAARLAPFAVLGVAILLGGLLVRRGLRSRRGAAAPADCAPESSRTLLRQLGDLEDDRAAGRVAEADYDRLRPALERQAAAASESSESQVCDESRTLSADRSGTHRGRWLVGAAVGVAATVGVSTVLVGALDQRAPGAVPTGDPPAAAASGDSSPAGSDAGDRTAATAAQLTRDQLASLQVAVDAVKKHPEQAATHVELARAYTEAGQPQLAAVEYLAATHLDPDNPEANTALALVAFKAGSAKQADALVSKALAAHPRYPEALYTRGLIRAMGLHRQAAAMRDLEAYQKAAPLGSHRTTVATVLALLASGAIK
jgi:cytochrome c-type biogenesis protein CcmH/NrfF